MSFQGGIQSFRGFDAVGEDDEDRRIISARVESSGDQEAVYSAIRLATEGVALLDNEDQMDPSARSHISRVDRIRYRRGAFKWLPVYCSNDIEHGSW